MFKEDPQGWINVFKALAIPSYFPFIFLSQSSKHLDRQTCLERNRILYQKISCLCSSSNLSCQKHQIKVWLFLAWPWDSKVIILGFRNTLGFKLHTAVQEFVTLVLVTQKEMRHSILWLSLFINTQHWGYQDLLFMFSFYFIGNVP